MIPVSCSSGGGEQKCAPKNRTPLARGAIEPFVYNGFPTTSIFLARDFENSPEVKVPLITRWNAPAFLLPVFQ